MTLINRTARLFKADLHAVLDRIEEPELLLRQSLREMEEDLDRDQQRLAGLQREIQQLAARGADLGRSLSELDDELDLCFAAANETLARALIKRKLEISRNRESLNNRLQLLTATRADLEARIGENRRRLEDVREKMEVLGVGKGATPGSAQALAGEPGIRDEEVEIALLREKQRRAQA
jgi:phage shock protein A